MPAGKRVPSPVHSEASSRLDTPPGVPPDTTTEEVFVPREKPPPAGTSPEKLFREREEASLKRGYQRPGKHSANIRAMHKQVKSMHASLEAALTMTPTEVGEIPRTAALIGDDAEIIFRERRTVHTSPNQPPPKLPPLRKVAHDMVPLCEFAQCKMLTNQRHLERFRHVCEHGMLCSERHDAEHARLFMHIDPSGELKYAPDATGWAAENWRDPKPLPDSRAARLRNGLPMVSCNARGGAHNRPHGGSEVPTDIGELSRARGKHKDMVVLTIEGIDVQWDDADLYAWVRRFAGTALVVSAVALRSTAGTSANSGCGLVTCQSMADAQRLMDTLHGRENATVNVRLAFQDPVLREGRDTEIFDHHGNLLMPNYSGQRRYNQAIRACGPYWEDAEALLRRMQDEGVVPNANTFHALLQCYRDGRPPQPQKAERLLSEIRRRGVVQAGHGVPLTAPAVNLVVDAWCRTGNMHRAEALVAEMERRHFKKWGGDPREDSWPTPTEETYLVLAEGWQRLGLAEEMAGRQRGYAYDEARGARREVGVGGNFGLERPAPSHLTSLARRRAGYSALHSGYFAPQKDPEQFNLQVLRHWRSRT